MLNTIFVRCVYVYCITHIPKNTASKYILFRLPSVPKLYKTRLIYKVHKSRKKNR